MIHIGIKAFSEGSVKDLTQIGTAVSEQGGDSLQLNIIPEIMIDIIKNIIQYVIPGRTSGGIHYHFRLRGYKKNNFIQVTALINTADDFRICGKRDFRRTKRMVYLFLDT